MRLSGCGILTAMPSPSGGYEVPLWRALAVFRVASLAYVCVLAVRDADRYAHPYAVGALILVMVVWTGVTAIGTPGRPGGTGHCCWPTSRWWCPSCCPPRGRSVGRRSPPAYPRWVSPGWPPRAGLGRGRRSPEWHDRRAARRRRGPGHPGTDRPVLVHRVILMLLAGVVVGHVARLAASADERLQRAVELEAATRERSGWPGHPRLGTPGAGAGPAAWRRPARRGW
ncbi:DUF5931 domain-containing protein [Micromonospora sp. M12]